MLVTLDDNGYFFGVWIYQHETKYGVGKELRLTVFDTQRLEDITDGVKHFELNETVSHTYAWITINDKRIGLCPKRKCPVNDVYSIRMKDDNGFGVNRLMEVADEIQDQIPVHLDPIMLHAKHIQPNVK